MIASLASVRTASGGRPNLSSTSKQASCIISNALFKSLTSVVTVRSWSMSLSASTRGCATSVISVKWASHNPSSKRCFCGRATQQIEIQNGKRHKKSIQSNHACHKIQVKNIPQKHLKSNDSHMSSTHFQNFSPKVFCVWPVWPAN